MSWERLIHFQPMFLEHSKHWTKILPWLEIKFPVRCGEPFASKFFIVKGQIWFLTFFLTPKSSPSFRVQGKELIQQDKSTPKNHQTRYWQFVKHCRPKQVNTLSPNGGFTRFKLELSTSSVDAITTQQGFPTWLSQVKDFAKRLKLPISNATVNCVANLSLLFGRKRFGNLFGPSCHLFECFWFMLKLHLCFGYPVTVFIMWSNARVCLSFNAEMQATSRPTKRHFFRCILVHSYNFCITLPWCTDKYSDRHSLPLPLVNLLSFVLPTCGSGDHMWSSSIVLSQ